MGTLATALVLIFQNCGKSPDTSSTFTEPAASLDSEQGDLNIDDIEIGKQYGVSVGNVSPLMQIQGGVVCEVSEGDAKEVIEESETYNRLRDFALQENENIEACIYSDVVEVEGPNVPDPCATANPAIGSVCKGGAIYAGLHNNQAYMVTLGGCTNSSNPVCIGSEDNLIRSWRGAGSTTFVNIPGLTNNDAGDQALPSMQTGDAATPLIVAHPSTTSVSAAAFCQNMVYAGYTDWYLPSKSELAYLYCKADVTAQDPLKPEEDPNCVIAGGKSSQLKGFAAQYYWSSTQTNQDAGRVQSFANGDQSWSAKNFLRYVRCVRKAQ